MTKKQGPNRSGLAVCQIFLEKHGADDGPARSEVAAACDKLSRFEADPTVPA